MPPILTTIYLDGLLATDAASPPYDYLAEYRLDEGTGTVAHDTSGNGRDGTLGAALGAPYRPTWSSTGLVFGGAHVVGLPNAALEGAGTVLVYSTPTLGVQSDFLGALYANVSGSSLDCGFSPGDGRPVNAGNDPYGQAAYASARPLLSGTLGVAWREDGTIYLNGQPIDLYAPPEHGVPPIPQYTGVTQASIGMYTSSLNGAFTGTIHWVVTYGRRLTDGQILAEHERIAPILQARGLTLGYSTALTRTLLAFAGDSMTLGYLATPPHLRYSQKAVALMSGSYNYLNMAIGGAASAEMFGQIAAAYNPVLPSVGGLKVLIQMIGTNENWGSTLANQQAAYPALKAAGWNYIVAVTGLPRFAADGPRATYNAALRLAIGTACDAVADWGGDVVVGAPGAYTNLTYYPDELHPSTSNHAIGASYVQAALASLGIL